MTERRLHWLEAAGPLAPWRQMVMAELAAGWEAAERRVSLPPIDILIQNVPNSGIPGLGMAAHAHRPNCFSLTLDPRNPHFPDALAGGAAQRLVVHELHHCLRFAAIGYNHTLGDALVSEGLACHFVRECLETPPEPWETALDPASLAEWTERARAEATMLRYDHEAWFHGRRNPGPPRWAGTSIGAAVVGQYLDLHPEAGPSRLVGIHAARLLKEIWP